jgi:membrane-associated phospholipid phosphatase
MILPNILDVTGHYVPLITFMMSCFYLKERNPYLIAFVIGFFINMFLNKILKITFKEPRPRGQIPFIDNEQLTGIEQYGFPSGHAQLSFFALAFLFFANGPQAVLYTMSFLCFLTLYQRWKYRRHSIKQLVFGAIFGTLFAYVTVYITYYYLHGRKSYDVFPL